ncbi:MAG: amidophosphoribosyltransferase [Bdellovibrionales bacterium GWB1_55_8]|nr:MAG: amidophosphoribosyltransferase [Bdellovibrionales bacterium GWB1_55_8]
MCGIVGLIGSRDAAREAFLGLTTLQHRGQDAAGILTYDSDGFHRVRNLGLVESVFTRENMATLPGAMAVGHARYSTIGRGDLIDVQPFLIGYPFGIGMVHNGNVVNCASLADDLRNKSRRHLLTKSDTEVVLNIFAEGLSRSASVHNAEELSFDHICEAVGHVFARAEGSYSIVSMVADQGLIAFRDPWGIRPLVWGKRSAQPNTNDVAEGFTAAHIVASESVALGFLGYEPVRDIQPGEVLFIDLKGNVHTRVLRQEAHRPCMFEWVYFASPESVMDGAPVYGTRIRLGRRLAKPIRRQMEERGLAPDIIVPVPETARIAAIALAEELGIPYREVLIKNRYIKRTFILDSNEKRQKAVNLKLSPVRSEIEGKKVLLMDDSIVRGTTSRKIIELVRQAGAAEVYFVSTCPPIQNPCFYGIDFPVESELIASGRTHAEIERELGADAVIFQDLQGLREAISESGGKNFNPCTACLDGKYPTGVAAAAAFAKSRHADRVPDTK